MTLPPFPQNGADGTPPQDSSGGYSPFGDPTDAGRAAADRYGATPAPGAQPWAPPTAPQQGAYGAGPVGYVRSEWESALRIVRGDGTFRIKESLTMGAVQFVRNPWAYVLLVLCMSAAFVIIGIIGATAIIFTLPDVGWNDTQELLRDPDLAHFLQRALNAIMGFGVLISLMIALFTPLTQNVALRSTAGERVTLGTAVPKRRYGTTVWVMIILQLPLLVIVGVALSVLFSVLVNPSSWPAFVDGDALVGEGDPTGFYGLTVVTLLVLGGVLFIGVLLSPLLLSWRYLPIVCDIGVWESFTLSLRIGVKNYWRLLAMILLGGVAGWVAERIFPLTTFIPSLVFEYATAHAVQRAAGAEYATLEQGLI
ncbi:hypothetical protein C1Y63_11020 [Corynebacterium sp. 13CS0277]|uniref:hypothetical protein n=1 Tax=Corynebacterium sp. 13CS0277 TaxID=2071994 RepID=UPI000D03638F|nr:hypothetical protein [Corynebacterium sp. 13CS0277]PRQ10510.1 hypothetical protein C1Y63_11020 [Corynebacterium sp. 13CS0277]